MGGELPRLRKATTKSTLQGRKPNKRESEMRTENENPPKEGSPSPPPRLPSSPAHTLPKVLPKPPIKRIRVGQPAPVRETPPTK